MFNRRCTSVMNTKTAICSGNCGQGAGSSRIPSRDSTEEGGVELNPVTFHCLPAGRVYGCMFVCPKLLIDSVKRHPT
ncbi:unnamed protein product [Sphagnum jensenii]|uniref:Uncharacterized protein n=1 Tax=Sphagnum jensenii TaxID=128206 RepID=A0ABP1BA34_9BRYO